MKSLIYIIFVAAAVVGEIGILYEDLKEHFFHDHSSPSSSSNNGNPNLPPNPSSPPVVSRFESLTECVLRISGSSSLNTNSDGEATPQLRALEWFFDGRPGQFIDPPPLSDQKARCILSSNDEFVQIYGLMVLKETLHINETSWSTTTSSATSISSGDYNPFVHNLSDICKRWHRIECNHDHTSVTKLHLSNMNMKSNVIDGNIVELSGSIPAEIANIWNYMIITI